MSSCMDSKKNSMLRLAVSCIFVFSYVLHVSVPWFKMHALMKVQTSVYCASRSLKGMVGHNNSLQADAHS